MTRAVKRPNSFVRPKRTARRGADLLVETLRAAGVRVIFGLSGNQVLPVFDACLDSGIRIVHTRHEAGAVYMADAWAQVTGELGVALVAAGPGFANGLSPLHSALRAESPVLLLSGDSPLARDGDGAFQELTQTAMSRPLAKAAFRPGRAEDIGRAAARMIRAALSGRPGPAHLALPMDLLNADASAAVPRVFSRRGRGLPPGAATDIVRLLRRTRRPVILTGPMLNASRAGEKNAALESALGAPVVPMESPRGLNDPALGAFAEILPRADLVALVGKAPDFSVAFLGKSALAESAQVVVLDPDLAVLNRAKRLAGGRLAAAFQADADLAADALIEAAQKSGGKKSSWLAEAKSALSFRGRTGADKGGGIHPRRICASAQRALERAANPVLVCDGGEFGQWAQAFCSAPVRVINGLGGSVGGALCHALGAKIARPDATVIALLGDGAAGFYFSEFDTAVREKAPLVVAIGNDRCWNAERQIQLRTYGPERAVGCGLSASARYDLVAAGFGGFGEHVWTAKNLDSAFSRALASGSPACLNIETPGAPAPIFRTKGKAG